MTICGLVRLAYDVHDYQIVDQPEWMRKRDPSAFYEIDARAAAGVTLTQDAVRDMIRNMLADRFHLIIHHELREASVYALVLASGDHRLSTTGFGVCPDATIDLKNLPTTRAIIETGRGRVASCTPSMTMAQLAEFLGPQIDRSVADQTGLTEKYAFRLLWSPGGPATADGALQSSPRSKINWA